MAKLVAPLFSVGAHATLGKALTYSQRRSGSQVRFQKKQTDYETSARIIQRGYFQTASSWWHELTDAEQGEWHGEGLEDC